MQWGGRKRLLNLVIVAPSEEFLINSSHKVEKNLGSQAPAPSNIIIEGDDNGQSWILAFCPTQWLACSNW